jgi:hypothetical protein
MWVFADFLARPPVPTGDGGINLSAVEVGRNFRHPVSRDDASKNLADNLRGVLVNDEFLVVLRIAHITDWRPSDFHITRF